MGFSKRLRERERKGNKMADGSIIYEVRVDDSKLDEDISRSEQTVEAAMSRIRALAQGSARELGDSLARVLGQEAEAAEGKVSLLSAGLEVLRGAASPLAAALVPLAEKLAGITSIDLTQINQLAGTAAGLAPDSSSLKTERKLAAEGVSKLSSGLDYVPRDEYPALLHKGEAVLSAAENAAYREAGGAGVLGALNAYDRAGSQEIVVENKVDMPDTSRPISVSLSLDGHQIAKSVVKATNDMGRQMNSALIRR